jgi:hypothetical protein
MKLISLLAAISLIALAQPRFEYWPGAVYDPSVPTPKKSSATISATVSPALPTSSAI